MSTETENSIHTAVFIAFSDPIGRIAELEVNPLHFRLRFPPVDVFFQHQIRSGLEMRDNVGSAAYGIIHTYLRGRNNREGHLKENTVIRAFGFEDNGFLILG